MTDWSARFKASIEATSSPEPEFKWIKARWNAKCKDPDCDNTVEAGDQVLWDPKTPGVWCSDCGIIIQGR